jgi:hypothetical protein
MSKHSLVTGKALFMVNISTMITQKPPADRSDSVTTGLDAGYIYRTGPSYDRPVGSIHNCSLDWKDNAGSFVSRTIGRVMA